MNAGLRTVAERPTRDVSQVALINCVKLVSNPGCSDCMLFSPHSTPYLTTEVNPRPFRPTGLTWPSLLTHRLSYTHVHIMWHPKMHLLDLLKQVI
jgi:hypothetical protein